MIRRLVLSSLAVTAVALALAAPASAHIHPDPDEAQAGSTLTVGFTIEHGCDGSPTVAVDMLMPDGVTDVSPEPLDGWTASVDADAPDGEVVTYEGGSLPDGTEGTFELTMTLPPTADATIHFPMVQRCEQGELRWIEVPVEGADEPEYPAPAMRLVGPVVTTTAPATTAPVTPETAPDTTPASTDAPADTTADTTADAPADTTAASTTPTSVASADGDDDSNTGTIVFIISVIAVLVVGAIAYTVARRNRTAGDTSAGGTSSDGTET